MRTRFHICITSLGREEMLLRLLWSLADQWEEGDHCTVLCLRPVPPSLRARLEMWGPTWRCAFRLEEFCDTDVLRARARRGRLEGGQCVWYLPEDALVKRDALATLRLVSYHAEEGVVVPHAHEPMHPMETWVLPIAWSGAPALGPKLPLVHLSLETPLVDFRPSTEDIRRYWDEWFRSPYALGAGELHAFQTIMRTPSFSFAPTEQSSRTQLVSPRSLALWITSLVGLLLLPFLLAWTFRAFRV